MGRFCDPRAVWEAERKNQHGRLRQSPHDVLMPQAPAAINLADLYRDADRDAEADGYSKKLFVAHRMMHPFNTHSGF